MIEVDLVVPVPPSKARPFQPLLAIAWALSRGLGSDYDPRCLTKLKETPELKSVEEMAAREAALRNAFDVRPDAVRGRHVLLLDDLYRSGASMREAARTLRAKGGPASLTVLALTRTRTKT
jgi:predicted amidophosphoribosyltransferase